MNYYNVRNRRLLNNFGYQIKRPRYAPLYQVPNSRLGSFYVENKHFHIPVTTHDGVQIGGQHEGPHSTIPLSGSGLKDILMRLKEKGKERSNFRDPVQSKKKRSDNIKSISGGFHIPILKTKKFIDPVKKLRNKILNQQFKNKAIDLSAKNMIKRIRSY